MAIWVAADQLDFNAALATEAARLGRLTKLADLEMLGLALEGMSLVSRAEVARGMRCLEEASAIAFAGEACSALAES